MPAVGVEDACSGIVSFHSSLMVALFLGEFLRLGGIRRGVLVLASCAIAVGGNLLRTLALCWSVHREGIGAVAAHHDRFGFYSSVAIFVGIFALAWLLARWKASPEDVLAPPEIGLRLFDGASFGTRGAVGALLTFGAVPVLGFMWFSLRPSGGAQVQEVPLWALRPRAAPAGSRRAHRASRITKSDARIHHRRGVDRDDGRMRRSRFVDFSGPAIAPASVRAYALYLHELHRVDATRTGAQPDDPDARHRISGAQFPL